MTTIRLRRDDKIEEITVDGWDATSTDAALQKQIDTVKAKLPIPALNPEKALTEALVLAFRGEIVTLRRGTAVFVYPRRRKSDRLDRIT
jgi:hypothetical protein